MKVTTKELALFAGKNIRRVRLRRNMSQELLAEKIGRTAQYISLLENGNRCASINMYLRISNELQLSPSELFSETARDVGNSDSECGVLNLLSGCTSYERRMLKAIISAAKEIMRSEA
jgi:transcriptional regulator with XRE-family HTH domain